MLNCKQVTAHASLIVDGELPAAQRFGVRVHLLICAQCRRFLRQLRGVSSAMRARGLQQQAAPVDAAVLARFVTALERLPPAHTPPGNPPPEKKQE
jgi:anti-sigma factor RsiW